MARVIRLFILSLLAVTLLGCEMATGTEGDDNGDDNGPTVTEGALIAQSLSDLPPARPDNEGQLYYVISEGRFSYSDGTQYVPIDLSGEDGQDGQDGSGYTQYDVYDNSGDYLGVANATFPSTGISSGKRDVLRRRKRYVVPDTCRSGSK
ncbi:MAG: hypothetical protein MI724_00560, partial [Spirochaetales bacterium]|nr:hypothetical protein [Spirochaetales bacterium]